MRLSQVDHVAPGRQRVPDQRSTRSNGTSRQQKALKIEMAYGSLLDSTPTPSRRLSREAVKLFLADKEAQHLRDSTISKLRVIFENQMLDVVRRDRYSPAARSDSAQPASVAIMWSDGPLASRKKQERVVGFFHFCQRNKWIDEYPALGLSNKADIRPAEYFPPEEFSQIVQVSHVMEALKSSAYGCGPCVAATMDWIGDQGCCHFGAIKAGR